MKRFFLILMLALLSLSLFAKGQEEQVTKPGDPVVLLFAVDGGIGPQTLWHGAIEGFVKEHPNVTVKWLALDVSSGGVEAMTAYLAAGIRPLLKDSYTRLSKYIDPEYALDLTPYVPDKADYLPGVLEMSTRNGKLLALQLGVQIFAQFANLDILSAAGYEVQLGWSTDDFMDMAAKVKANGDWPTFLFAKNQNADYFYMQYFADFGAVMYENADYSHSALNSQEGVRAMRFLNDLYQNGYVPSEAPIYDAGDYLRHLYTGQIATGVIFGSSIDAAINGQVTQGAIDKAWEYKFVDFPRGPGVESVAHTSQFHGLIAPRSDYLDQRGRRLPKDQIVDDLYGELVIVLRDVEESTYLLPDAAIFPSHKMDIPEPRSFRFYYDLKALLDAGGIWDQGLSLPEYAAIRTLMYPRLQAMWSGETTPEEALAMYEENVNKILAGEE